MALQNDKLAGVYRLNTQDFPAPITSWPDEQPIASGLNGIPILASYKMHQWQWNQLESVYAEYLYSLFSSQQTNNAQLSSIETDPYSAALANESYGTQSYNDVTILSVGSRTRGMPMYDDVVVTFEIYVG